MILFYNKPASEWVEAIPVGNGRMGAMIFGRPADETIQLNECTFWSSRPYAPTNPDALAAMSIVRQLIFDGKNKEAQDLIDSKMMGIPAGQASFLTAGNLNLNFPDHQQPEDYCRKLDLSKAITTVEYKCDNVNFKREIFASAVDNVIVISLTADKKGKINFTVSFSAPQKKQTSGIIGKMLYLDVYGRESHGIEGVLRCRTGLKVLTAAGKTTFADNKIHIENADSAILILTSATNYINYTDFSGDPEKTVAAALLAAAKKTYNKILTDHIEDYQRFFNRVELNLGQTDAAKLPTNERIKNFAQNDDPQLVSLFFQFGRYLLISCSRPGGQPANLQGIWNDSEAPPWGSKYTININTEMNYWPAEPTNLSECHQPLFAMIKDISITGQKTAKAHYNAAGWVCHHNTDIWRATAPISNAFYGFWPMGGAWLCQHLWYHYEYIGDNSFLKNIYPIIKGSAQFFVDTLVEHPKYKWLVTCPSMSPENAMFDKVSSCAGPAMDMQILRDLFGNCITAAQILGIDEDFCETLKQKLSRLAPMQIGRHGQLQEWLEDIDCPETNHRHVSHLYGLFPSNQINKFDTPELFAAAQKSLEIRGDGGTGWSMAWKINFWTHLFDGDHAYKMLTRLISTGTYPNMFDAHPPFQIDGNFGAARGICEMLMHSCSRFSSKKLAGEIHLLPALPQALSNGSVKGLRAKGGFEVDIEWKNGVLIQAKIKSLLGSDLKIIYRDETISKTTKPGETYFFTHVAIDS